MLAQPQKTQSGEKVVALGAMASEVSQVCLPFFLGFGGCNEASQPSIIVPERYKKTEHAWSWF